MKTKTEKIAKIYLIFTFAVCLGISLGAMRLTKYFPLKGALPAVTPVPSIAVTPLPVLTPGVIPEPTITPAPLAGISGWKIYTDQKKVFELKYPADILKISQEDSYIKISHSIPFVHEDPCDFKGGAPALKKLTDFNANIEVKDLSLIEAVRAKEGKLAEEYIAGDTLSIKDEYVEKVQIAQLDGFRFNNSFEWCGSADYYFPVGINKTLFVQRFDIAELALDPGRYSGAKGVIMPQEADVLFKQIISTFKPIK